MYFRCPCTCGEYVSVVLCRVENVNFSHTARNVAYGDGPDGVPHGDGITLYPMVMV